MICNPKDMLVNQKHEEKTEMAEQQFEGGVLWEDWQWIRATADYEWNITLIKGKTMPSDSSGPQCSGRVDIYLGACKKSH